MRPLLQLLGLGLVESVVLVQSFVEVALELPDRFVQYFPTHEGLVRLCEYLGKLAHLFGEFGSGEGDRLHSKAQSPSDFPEGGEDVLDQVLLLGGYSGEGEEAREVVGGVVEQLPGVEEGLEVWLVELCVLAGEDGVEVPAGEDGRIGEYLVVAFDVGEVHLLLEQELVQLAVLPAVHVPDQLVQVLPDQSHAHLRRLLPTERIVYVQHGDHKAPVLLRHVLHQVLHL